MRGRTVLISKDGCKGKPDQYKPITVLNTAYKLFTGVLAGMSQQYVFENDLLPLEQKALRKGRRGCYDALMVDAMITEIIFKEEKALSKILGLFKTSIITNRPCARN